MVPSIYGWETETRSRLQSTRRSTELRFDWSVATSTDAGLAGRDSDMFLVPVEMHAITNEN